MRALVLCLLATGCQSGIHAGGGGPAAGGESDPLDVAAPAEDGSLDDLYRKVVQPTCASQPGACHAGQFEPNMSTPALLYANLVNRPGLEHEKQLRVQPGDPDHSLVIDKLRNRNVGTQMPLGAKPLTEDKLALFERWIRDGALRRPGAQPAPQLNNPPLPPELAVFDPAGQRLDAAGPIDVTAGQALVLRQSVHDFETGDDQMAYPGFFLYTADGRQVVLAPGDPAPYFGQATYEANAPAGTKYPLDWVFHWSVPAQVGLIDAAGVTTEEPSTGLSLTVIGYYADDAGPDGIATFTTATDLVKVK